jgi:hypothetical protein
MNLLRVILFIALCTLGTVYSSRGAPAPFKSEHSSMKRADLCGEWTLWWGTGTYIATLHSDGTYKSEHVPGVVCYVGTWTLKGNYILVTEYHHYRGSMPMYWRVIPYIDGNSSHGETFIQLKRPISHE